MWVNGNHDLLRALTALSAYSGGRGSVTGIERLGELWLLSVGDGDGSCTVVLHGVDRVRAAFVAGVLGAGTTLVLGDVVEQQGGFRVRLLHRPGPLDLVCETLGAV